MICYKHGNERDKHKNCNICHKERTAERRRRAIALFGGVCADCGIDDERVFEFDHLHSKEKSIGPLLTGSWEKALKELEKCELVCGNCHNIRTHERRNS